MHKKKFLFIVLLFLISCSMGKNDEGTFEIVFFPGLEVKEGKYFKLDATQPFTGSTKSTYLNGSPYVTASFKNGMINDIYTAYYIDGQKMGETHYKMGVKHGESVSWHENGQIASRVNFVNGKKEGRLVAWYANGQKSAEAFFDSGKLDSTFTRWKITGELFSTDTYKNGKLIKREYFNGNSEAAKTNI